MLDGDLIETAFSSLQLAELEKALYRANLGTSLDYSIYVGALAAGRDSAVAVHRSLADPSVGVLVAVDPGSRTIEVVTGEAAKVSLDDQVCRLAILTMTSRFAIGDIATGLRDGILVLAEHARQQKVIELHVDEPENF